MRQKTTGILPIFHDKNIFYHFNNNQLPFDDQGLYRPLEMMLLPGQEFELMGMDKEGVAQIQTQDNKKYYTFEAMLKLKIGDLGTKRTACQIIENLMAFKGCPYIWGSNWILSPQQVHLMTAQLQGFTNNFIKNISYVFSGLDCSGLLYAATLGYVPRNTVDLVNFGRFISIARSDNKQICRQVRPLDLLVWKGHVLIFLDENTLIESRKDFGCVIVEARARLDEIRQTRAPANQIGEDKFYIKRWVDAS